MMMVNNAYDGYNPHDQVLKESCCHRQSKEKSQTDWSVDPTEVARIICSHKKLCFIWESDESGVYVYVLEQAIKSVNQINICMLVTKIGFFLVRDKNVGLCLYMYLIYSVLEFAYIKFMKLKAISSLIVLFIYLGSSAHAWTQFQPSPPGPPS